MADPIVATIPDRSPIPVGTGVRHPAGVDEPAIAELLPTLYRSILDGVARLERAGERQVAGRIRVEAIRAYSKAWDDRNRRRLEQLLVRLERALEAHPRVLGTNVLSQHPAG